MCVCARVCVCACVHACVRVYMWVCATLAEHPTFTNAESSAPVSLQVVDTGPHSALLRWETPSHPNGVIVSYHIRYQRGLADEALSYETNTSSIDASYLLADLLPTTAYTVTVAAINGAGIGLFSEEQGFMTTALSELVQQHSIFFEVP